MPRRTITLAHALEKSVRTQQAKFMLQTNRDISFTETVNVLIAAAIAVKPDEFPDLQRYQELLEGTDFDSEALFDQIQETLQRRKWDQTG